MTFENLVKLAEEQSKSIYIDSVFPRNWRRVLQKATLLLTLSSFIASLFGPDPLFDGLSLFCLAIFTFLSLFEAFYNSSRFAGLTSHLPERNLERNGLTGALEYAVAQVIWKASDRDITQALLESEPGDVLFFRLGISSGEIDSFLKSERIRVDESALDLPGEFVSFADLAKAIYQSDKSLASFLSAHSISSGEFEGAAEWIGHELLLELEESRWWGRDNLESSASLGVSFDYGMAYELSRYGVSISNGAEFASLDLENGYRVKEVQSLENILSRTEEANAIIIDDDESISRAILERLLKKIQTGQSVSLLRNKNIIELDWNSLTADKKSKGELETEILKLFRGAVSAGNVVVYIPNLPNFIASVKTLGVNLPGLLEEFLHSRSMHLISHSTKTDFHYFIETNSTLIRMFERLIPDEEGVAASMPPIIEKARSLEWKYNRHKGRVFFSYPALLSIAESAERFMTYGEMPTKALDLLEEIAPWALKENITVLSGNDVLRFVTTKTGVATGEIGKEEGEKLANLEEILHKRIIGQNEAVSAISSAMRRARSGITNPKRPFASFLFLGPTGVGKTETTKALAQSFFEHEEKIIRFDMSEFNGPEALPALIGSFSENRSGVLASKIRDNPYGVLLLDEFEKASPDVRDLFLQVLDEGEFTDALGNKVNCRNLIIIATSNAGSGMIWKLAEEKQDLNVNKQKIINSLIEERIYKPELLNRFDGTIIFHPLLNEELEKVATLQFAKLKDRVKKEKDVEISMSPDLLSFLVQNANGQEFGARSINRLMQEKIEDFVAKKIVTGEAGPGSILEIKRDNIS
jgi:ATP-dependent Clp protease ATP-binding subunit ClpC